MALLMIGSYADSFLLFRGPLIEALRHKGVDVHVAGPGFGAHSPVRAALERMGVRVHDVPLHRTGRNPLSDLQTLLWLVRLMRRIQPTFVIAYTIKPVIYGVLAAWLAGVPRRFALITGLGFAFQDSRKRGLLAEVVERLYRLALRRVEKVFFQNPDDEALFRLRGILRSGVPRVILNGSGVDLERFALSPIPLGPVRFLLIARLLGAKGVREYAEAARRVRKRFPEVRFGLVGWIDENPDSIHQSELDRWIEEGSMEYWGHLADVRTAIADCTVYVLPSYREGTPRTVLEAMSAGRAIITTDAPGCRETVLDGENGFLIPVQSVDALEQAMLKFIADPQLAGRMGQRSRQIAEDRYDVHKVNAVMLREMGLG